MVSFHLLCLLFGYYSLWPSKSCFVEQKTRKLVVTLHIHTCIHIHISDHLRHQVDYYNLRLRYMRVKVKRTSKSSVKPTRAPTPIQYQFFSGKMSKLFNMATPNLLVLSEACMGSNIGYKVYAPRMMTYIKG